MSSNLCLIPTSGSFEDLFCFSSQLWMIQWAIISKTLGWLILSGRGPEVHQEHDINTKTSTSCILRGRLAFSRVSAARSSFLEEPWKKLDYYAFASPLLCGAPPFKVTQDHLGGAFFCQSSAELHVLACSLDTEFCSSRARVLQVFWSSFLVVIVPSRCRSRCGL